MLFTQSIHEILRNSRRRSGTSRLDLWTLIIRRNVHEVSSDPLFVDWYVRFTMVPRIPFSDQELISTRGSL